MTEFITHTVETAPEASKPILERVKKKFGFVTNLMATMSESPVLLESYLTMMGLFEKTDLSPTEREIILMTNNRLNGCTYCMAAHSTVAKKRRIDDSVIESLRSGSPINDPKLEALRTFAVIIHETHGRPTDAQIDAFLAAGYTKQTILEVIVGTSLKVLSNYTTPLTKPQIDDPFVPMAWTPDMASAV